MIKQRILNVKISANKSLLSPVINASNMHPLRIVSVAMVAKSLHGTCSSAKDYRLPKKKMIPARLLRELRIKSLHKPSISRQSDDNRMIGWFHTRCLAYFKSKLIEQSQCSLNFYVRHCTLVVTIDL